MVKLVSNHLILYRFIKKNVDNKHHKQSWSHPNKSLPSIEEHNKTEKIEISSPSNESFPPILKQSKLIPTSQSTISPRIVPTSYLTRKQPQYHPRKLPKISTLLQCL